MNRDETIAPYDVLQIRPDNTVNRAFDGCLLIVTDNKGWGVMGYVPIPGPDRDIRGGRAWVGVPWEDLERVGRAHWIATNDEQETESQTGEQP